jgi:hypothetical protein
LQVGDKV